MKSKKNKKNRKVVHRLLKQNETIVGKKSKEKWYPKYAPHIVLGTNRSVLDNDKPEKIILNKLDPLGRTVETLELTGVWQIIVGENMYIMTNRYVDKMKINFEKMQKHFLDNV